MEKVDNAGMEILNRLRTLNKKIPKQLFKIEMAKSNAEPKSPVIDGMPHEIGGFHSKTESGAIKLQELQDMYIELLAERQELVQKVDTAVEKMKEPEERAILRMRYIRAMSLEDIGDVLYRCERQTRRYLRKAEEHVIEYL